MLISKSRKHEQEYKEGYGGVFLTSREIRGYWKVDLKLNQFVKLPKGSYLTYQVKAFRKFLYKEGVEVQITNWIDKINIMKRYFNREKPKKEVSFKEKKGVILVVLLLEWSIKFFMFELQVFRTLNQMQ